MALPNVGAHSKPLQVVAKKVARCQIVASSQKILKTACFRCDFVTVLKGYQFLEIAGDREMDLRDFGLRRGWLKQESSEGLGKGNKYPPSRVEILGGVG